jgi:hypothetical protein
MINTTLHKKLKIEQHETTKNRGYAQVLWKVEQFLLH